MGTVSTDCTDGNNTADIIARSIISRSIVARNIIARSIVARSIAARNTVTRKHYNSCLSRQLPPPPAFEFQAMVFEGFS